MLMISESKGQCIQRQDAFREFAQRRASGAVMVPPTMLPREERRLHVRQTLREDHQFRIHNRPEGAQTKFDKLADSPFAFFRGTALLYYRDQAGTDADLPIVFTIGDVHPENFGVMPNENDAPFFGLDDFDEAYFAPFSWDVKRGAIGFFLIARENGHKKKKCRKAVKSFVRGYLDGLIEFARDDREKWHQLRIDNSPPMIRDLLKASLGSRKDFLAELIDLDTGRFSPSDEIVPHSRYVPQFQEAIDHYVENNKIPVDTRAAHFKVKDVAIKKGSGTASLGLDRYFVMIDGPDEHHADDIILEMKQARLSALHGLAPGNKFGTDEAEATAERITDSHHVHVAGGDAYYGTTEMDGMQFLVRERSPYKSDIDVDDLDSGELKEYARICGMTLAQAHARSDEDTETLEGQAEKAILSSIQHDVFVGDVLRFAEIAAKRICADYDLFCQDHTAGAFQYVRE